MPWDCREWLFFPVLVPCDRGDFGRSGEIGAHFFGSPGGISFILGTFWAEGTRTSFLDYL